LANNNTIGGTASGAGNVIDGNGLDGVDVDDWDGSSSYTGTPGTGNAIRRNSILNTAAGQLSINLIHGGNHNQAAPTLAYLSNVGGTTKVTGSLSSTASTSFSLEFFISALANPAQGKTYLSSLTVTTNGAGQVNFTAALGANVSSGQYVTAT